MYSSKSDITPEKIKFELYIDVFYEFSFTDSKDGLEEVLDISNITSEHLQDDMIGARIISKYRLLESEERLTDGYFIFLLGYARSAFRDFES